MSKEKEKGPKPIKYVPKACMSDQVDKQGKAIVQLFKGHIMLIPPSIEQKYEYLGLANVEVDENGKPKGSNVELLQGSVRLIKASKDHYASIELERLDNGYKYSSYEDMQYDSDCHGVIEEVAGLLMQGLSPGKLSKPA